MPFPPGERKLVYSYRLAKPKSDEFVLPLEIHYPTDSLDVMIAGEDVEVASTTLIPSDPIDTDSGQRFIRFRGENLPRGTVINLRLANLSGGGGLSFVILWVIIAVVIAGGAFYLMKRSKQGNTHE